MEKAGEKERQRMAVRLGKEQHAKRSQHLSEAAQGLGLKMVEDQASHNDAAGYLGKCLK